MTASGLAARPRRLVAARRRTAFLLTLPSLLAIGLLVLYPLGYSINESFRNRDGAPSIDNYSIALANPAFLESMANTVEFTVLMVAIEMLLGLLVALSLQEVGSRARSLLRALFMVPLLVAPVVAAYQWSWMLNGQYGPVGALLQGVGVTPPLWLSDPGWAFFTVVLVDVWIATPFAVLIFQSALSSLPEEIYEAARLDGVSRWQSFWHITRPLLKPAFLIVLVIRTMDAFRTYDIVAVLTGGGPGLATSTLSVIAVQTGIDIGQLGVAAAMSILTLLPILVVTLVYLRVIRITS